MAVAGIVVVGMVVAGKLAGRLAAAGTLVVTDIRFLVVAVSYSWT